MRTRFIAGNWKMFKTVQDATVYAKELRALVKDIEDVRVVIAPPYTAIHACAEALRNSNVSVSAQNMFWEREGAFTGEISAPIIKEAGAEYVIIGHSERRTLFGENDVTVNRKVLAAIAGSLMPIVCIGETLEQRDRNETLDVIDRQMKGGLDSLTGDQIAAIVIAYEPVWAIGTGRNATPAQAGEVHAHIRSRVRQWFGAPAADASLVIYGGSVKPDNIQDLIAQPDVDGALVGGASLDVRAFHDIIVKSRRAPV
jgi:triosephosphate isomerase